jgi:hypothetical protein
MVRRYRSNSQLGATGPLLKFIGAGYVPITQSEARPRLQLAKLQVLLLQCSDVADNLLLRMPGISCDGWAASSDPIFPLIRVQTQGQESPLNSLISDVSNRPTMR